MDRELAVDFIKTSYEGRGSPSISREWIFTLKEVNRAYPITPARFGRTKALTSST
jgi:hypothetical protein